MNRSLASLTLAVLAAGACSTPALADVIHLRDGQTLEGRVLAQRGDTLTIQGRYGQVVVEQRDVLSIERKLTVEDRYGIERSDTDLETPSGQERLARWCRENGMLQQAERHDAEARTLRDEAERVLREAEARARAQQLRTRRDAVPSGDGEGLARLARWAAHEGYADEVVDGLLEEASEAKARARAQELRTRRDAVPDGDGGALVLLAQWAAREGHDGEVVGGLLEEALIVAPEDARPRVALELRQAQAQAAAAQAQAERDRGAAGRELGQARATRLEVEHALAVAQAHERALVDRERALADRDRALTAELAKVDERMAAARAAEGRAQAAEDRAAAHERRAADDAERARCDAERARCDAERARCDAERAHQAWLAAQRASTCVGGQAVLCSFCHEASCDGGCRARHSLPQPPGSRRR